MVNYRHVLYRRPLQAPGLGQLKLQGPFPMTSTAAAEHAAVAGGVLKVAAEVHA